MSSKKEVIEKIIPTQNYLGSFVKSMILEITCEEKQHPPLTFKKGDVIRICKPLNKPRPSVIIKVTKEYVISIPLTSTESVHCLAESESRFFSTGCFCNSYEVTPLEVAKESFIGVYDNPKALTNAIKELRVFIKQNI